jgi:hypothetical protein
MNSLNDIKLAFNKQKSGRTIVKIIDYGPKNMYVIVAVPSNSVKDADKWIDGRYAMDKDSLKILGGFNPIKHDPDIYFNLPESSVIYEKEGYGNRFK